MINYQFAIKLSISNRNSSQLLSFTFTVKVKKTWDSRRKNNSNVQTLRREAMKLQNKYNTMSDIV